MSALRHSRINARRASDWRTVTEAACGCYRTFDSPEDAVGMRWSSSSCRMLLQMSLNSFSTCVTRHGTGQTWKIRLRERPRRGSPRGERPAGSPGRANARFRNTDAFSVPLAAVSARGGVRPVLLCCRSGSGCHSGIWRPSQMHPAAPLLCASAVAGSSQGRSVSHASRPARRVLELDGPDARYPHANRLVLRRGGSKSRQPALNRRSSPGGRGTDAEGPTTSLETYGSAGRAHTSWRYFLIRLTCSSLPLESSFCSMEEMILHEARRAPMTFL